MTIYSLYIKTHKKTGLKYFGYTKQNPYTYYGSGSDWKKHLTKYGYMIDTEVLLQTDDKAVLIHWGIFYSRLWNIVSAQDDYGNKIWANKIPETGSGSGRKQGSIMSEDSKELIRIKAIGRTQTEQTKKKRRGKRPNFSPWNKGILLTEVYSKEERKIKYGSAGKDNPMHGKPVPKKICPHCNKEVDIRNFARSHGDRCKFK